MHRIDTETASNVLEAPGAAGPKPNAFFLQETAMQDGTILDVSYLNSLQEEICAVIINAGLTLDKSLTTQLYDAILEIIANGPLNTQPLTDNLDTNDFEIQSVTGNDLYINASGDVTFNTERVRINADFKIGSGIAVNEFIDEDDLVSDSSTAIPTGISVINYLAASDLYSTKDQILDIRCFANIGLAATASTNLLNSIGSWMDESFATSDYGKSYSITIPFDGVLQYFDVYYGFTDSGSGSPTSFKFHVAINGINAGISITDTTFTGHATPNNSSTINVVAGDLLTIRVENTVGNKWVLANYMWSLKLTPT